jgi:FMN phosphatase YigB (HAD superfamily)
MKNTLAYLCLLLLNVDGFVVSPWRRERYNTHLFSTTKTEIQTLGLLTFDLDDTLYPIAPVEADANDAFVQAMKEYGFTGLKPEDIVESAKAIRAEIGKDDPEKAAILTHTEIRELAIRREMEKATLANRLEALAEDEGITVDALDDLVVKNAQT